MLNANSLPDFADLNEENELPHPFETDMMNAGIENARGADAVAGDTRT